MRRLLPFMVLTLVDPLAAFAQTASPPTFLEPGEQKPAAQLFAETSASTEGAYAELRSLDEDVVVIDDGAVSGRGWGETLVIGTLPDGRQDTARVVVMPDGSYDFRGTLRYASREEVGNLGDTRRSSSTFTQSLEGPFEFSRVGDQTLLTAPRWRQPGRPNEDCHTSIPTSQFIVSFECVNQGSMLARVQLRFGRDGDLDVRIETTMAGYSGSARLRVMDWEKVEKVESDS